MLHLKENISAMCLTCNTHWSLVCDHQRGPRIDPWGTPSSFPLFLPTPFPKQIGALVGAHGALQHARLVWGQFSLSHPRKSSLFHVSDSKFRTEHPFFDQLQPVPGSPPAPRFMPLFVRYRALFALLAWSTNWLLPTITQFWGFGWAERIRGPTG